jgi:hypothetical protein
MNFGFRRRRPDTAAATNPELCDYKVNMLMGQDGYPTIFHKISSVSVHLLYVPYAATAALQESSCLIEPLAGYCNGQIGSLNRDF